MWNANNTKIKLNKIFHPEKGFFYGSFSSNIEIKDETYEIYEDESDILYFRKNYKIIIIF